MSRLEQIARELRDMVAGLAPATYDGRDAARLTKVAAEVERLGAAAKILFAKRAVDANAWRATSHAATPEQWLAHLSGSSEGAAREALATADRVSDLPATQAKLRDGSLSLAQAALVSQGASVDPDVETTLLRIAGRGEMRNLRAEKERVVAAATDAEETQARAHRNRYLRTWTGGVESHGAFAGPTTEVDRLLRALEPLRKLAFERDRTDGPRESQHAYMFDGLVALADGEASKRSSAPTGPVRVDVSPLLTGKTAPGEVCEIPGVGPVPVSHARQVLSHGLLELVLHDGTDVRAVVTRTRHVAEALKIAIDERDQHCKVRGCDATEHLERHHVDDFATHQVTSYEVLGNVCPEHHDIITYDSYSVEVHDDGSWTLHPANQHAGEQRDIDAA
jgi:hypothetical protein